MEIGNSSVGQLQEAAGHYAPGLLLLTLLSLVVSAALTSWLRRSGEPPSVSDPIPFVFNTLQFLINNERFMERAKNALKDTSLATFHQGTNLVYLVSGPKNVQAIFGRSQTVNNDEFMLRSTLPLWYRMSKKDIQRFAADNSGRGRNPVPGTESTPKDQRYFFGYEHVHTEYLARAQYLNPLVEHYQCQISQTLDRYSAREWTTLSVMNFCKREVTKCAVHTLMGPKIFELNPDFLDLMWDFDDVVFSLAMGFPKWIYSRPYRVHDRYLATIREYLDLAWARFDWNGPSATARWEPHFGAQISREVVKWLRDSGFNEPDTGAGAIGILVWAQNSNVIPTTTWIIIELAKDPSLFRALRQELTTAYTTDPQTGSRTLDVQKLTALPLLTSVYTETLRLRMNFNVTRNVKEPFSLAGYTIHKGAMLQAPTAVAHYDEDVWGAEGHPAAEFWAERHVQSVDDKDASGHGGRKRVFAMAGRSGSYFPYGGGNLICPGRHFAKQEIMLTIGLLVSRFDVEFVEWCALDGSGPSDRAARNDARYCGGGATPPDRDLKVRIRRID